MRGPQLIRLLDVLPITSARNAVGVSPRSVIITVDDPLQNIESVLFNGMRSPNFVVYAEHELIAQVPTVIEDAVLTDIAVLSAVATMTSRSLVELTIGTKVRSVSGVQRLVQTFIRMLLRTGGSNIFHKTTGGGLLRSVGGNITSQLAADIAAAVSSTRAQIIAEQTPVSTIADTERLLAAEISNLVEDPNSASVFVTVMLTSHAQTRSAATFVA